MRQDFINAMVKLDMVSIHASRVGCDKFFLVLLPFEKSFNPRIPCGMRPSGQTDDPIDARFQSTHPVWDATKIACIRSKDGQFQSTHPVWDAT